MRCSESGLESGSGQLAPDDSCRPSTRSAPSRPSGCHRAAGAALAVGAVLALPVAVAAQEPQVFAVPQVDWGWEMLDLRKNLQERTRDRFDVEIGFAFTDRLAASGITFRHQATPDSGKFYQPNHYDHGNGVAVADVDGDGLYDLYFSTQLGRNELWRNLGGGRFEDWTERAGVALADRLGVSASFADVDNDGDPDLYATTVRGGNTLFLNDGDGRFRDVTAEAGLEYSGHSSGATFFDYDGDGRLDLFLANVGVYTTEQRSTAGYWIGIAPDAQGRDAFSGHLFPERTEYSILYHNEGGGRFRDVSVATGLRDGSWSGDAAFDDVNGDGRPDLYVPNMQGDDHYWQNVDGSSFVDRSAERFPRTPWGTMGIKFFDFDNDGRRDLLLTDMHSDMSAKVTPGFEKVKSRMTWDDATLQGGANNIFGNAFFEHRDEGPWMERSDELGLENYWPWGVSVADVNADGGEDVLITSSMNFPYTYGVNSLLLNNRGEKFLDAEFLLGIEPRPALASRPWYDPARPWLVTKRPWFDLDCAGEDGRHPLCRGRQGPLSVWGNVGTRAAAIFDLDEDGDLDIVTNEFHGLPQLLVSDLADNHEIKYLEVELTGSRSNRDGLGARVTVVTPEGSYTRVHDGKSGYLSQSSLPLYFGLGAASRVDRLEITWPSGATQTVTENLALNRLVEVTEPR